jgi:hypothetical protein
MLIKRIDLALASLDKATALDPDGKYLLGTSRSTRMQACFWEGFGADLERIAKGVSERRRICNPLVLAALIDSQRCCGLQRKSSFETRSMARAGRISGESPKYLPHRSPGRDRPGSG